MKKFVIFSITVLMLLWIYQINVDAGNCKKPSPNCKLCYSPTNNVTSCSDQPPGWCQGYSQYVINPFPDGSEEAANGHVSEELADCYIQTTCIQNTNVTACLVAMTLPPVQKAKKIILPNDPNPNVCE